MRTPLLSRAAADPTAGPESAADGTSTYLYAVTEGPHERLIPGIAGLDGVGPVSVVASGSLGAVVSAYRGPRFEARSKDELVRSLLAHQRIIEEVMADGVAVVPVKFGTVLASEDEVRALLAEWRGGFAEALASIRDKVEFEVAATWRLERMLGEVSVDDDVVRARADITRGGPPTLTRRVWLGQLVKARLDERRARHRDEITRFLQPLALRVAAHGLLSDEMVVNLAFLVERRREREFDEAVRELDRRFEDALSFRVIGPLPPYSFCTAEVRRLSASELAEARQTLQLQAHAGPVEVRKAYRRLAAAAQLRRSGEDEVARGQLATLRRASELLLAAYPAEGDARRDGGTPGRVRPSFVVALRGSGPEEVDPARFGASTEHAR